MYKETKILNDIGTKTGERGITLIALVITIIVLLILAGITIASISSQDSAPNKAAEARIENDKGAARDIAAMLVTEKIQNYYEGKYVKNDATAKGAANILEYLQNPSVLGGSGQTQQDYTVVVSSGKITVKKAGESTAFIEGTLTDDGKINWPGTTTVSTITFTIDGTAYEVPAGYTWADAINNNIVLLYDGGNGLVIKGGDAPVLYNDQEVYMNDSIIENGIYTIWCCFDPEMKVLMADRTTKEIKDVEEGDLVMSLNEDTGKFISQKVTKKIIREHSDDLVYVNLSNGKRIGMRAYHPLLTANGWKSLRPEWFQTISEVGPQVDLLKVGDELIGFDEKATIVSIEFRGPIENYTTYNLTVEGYHNYIVENFVVHNGRAPC